MKKAFILLPLLAAQIVLAQEKKTITGKIDDGDTSKVIAGASIKIETQSVSTKTNQTGIIESVSIGTITDKNGNYTLEIPADTRSVTVSYLGYEPKIIQIYEGQTSYNITLIPVVSDDIPEKNNIQEVIITGYQKIEKRKQTSAVTTVKMNDIQQAGVASVDQLLAGQIAGVAVTPETGAPGSPAKIRIRGTASLSGPQDPLWVIDGLPLEGNDVPNFSDKDNIDQLQNFSIAGLNPNDIEDITILKDAAATAIYGARAANGVISITTKKGKKGSLRVNFSADTFITARPDFGKLNLLNASEKVDLELMLANRTDLTYRTDKGEVMRILTQNGQLDAYRNGGLGALNMLTRQQIDGLRNSNTDWGKLLYQNAINKQYGVSISGGSDRSDYYFSLGYYDEEGTTIGTGFERYNLTLKNNYKINDKLNFGVSVFGTQSERTSFVTDADASISPINYSRNANPYLSPYNADGSYRYDKDIDGFEDRYIPFNFLEERENTSYTLKNQSLKAIFDLDYKLAKGLKITSQLGLQYDGNKTEKFAAENTYFTRKMKEGTRYYKDGAYRYFLPDGGVKQNWDNSFFQYNWKLQGSYSTKINSVHEIDLMAGTELRKTEDNTTVTRAFGYDSVTRRSTAIVFPSSNFAAERKYETYREMPPIENAYASMFATASYTYDQKYTFFGSVRYDGTNLFGVNKKYKYLPIWAVSGSWLVSKEDFMKNLSAISNLRLRASYGLQGNIDRNTSPFFIGEYSDSTILPGGKENIINVISPPNDKLRWEKTTNVNFGLDLGVFNNRINLTAVTETVILRSKKQAIDFFKNDSADLIFMDIHLGDGMSLEIFEQVELFTPIIFITAFDEYAMRVFKHFTIDYLLKPFEEEDLHKALQKFISIKGNFDPEPVLKSISSLYKANDSEKMKHFIVTDGNKIRSVDEKGTAYFFASGKYLFLTTTDNRTYIYDDTIKDIIQKLTPPLFFKINRKFIINKKAIVEIIKHSSQKIELKLSPAPEINSDVFVSKRQITDFLHWMSN
ncbi:SusC/RagA family TonB-linked outer membrane protein [Chryseobacterium scophthalmum]|uniref:Two component transcriptional regulator, LytTR family n=1 Tax=Chryseobacterium scophthalmum TaxID=59733 RepID=A0A1N6EKR7_9FLAO|nr:SusC/RagA family TonB-linked outer membrane protein [Chryseobacterium scophthalmum]SIN83575.1 two component transcriptional regulator, LytTR family [Chryseobacterium scophthalmum]